MIKIKLKKYSNIIKHITITGHALYADFGKDIVCAAVSSCVITSVNASLLINKDSLSYDDKNGLDINMEIAEKDSWTIDDIKNRTTALVNKLMELYKFPR